MVRLRNCFVELLLTTQGIYISFIYKFDTSVDVKNSAVQKAFL